MPAPRNLEVRTREPDGDGLRHMTMRTWLLVVLLLAGCGTASPPVHEGAVPTPAVTADPMDLVGMWRVQVDGTAAGVLRVGEEITLFQDCGGLNAAWRASHDGGFVAYSAGGSGTCFVHGRSLLPAWVEEAQGFRVDGDERVLVDAAGRVLVTLLPGGKPRLPASMSAEYYGTTPTPAPELARRMAEPAPLPAGLRPATSSTILGRWQAPDHPRAFLAFAADGSWTGSDGCNGQGGRYSVGEAGEILAVSGGSTLIGCANSAAGGWLNTAKRAGRDDDQLVLLDEHAHELGRLRLSA
jgi:hypothetical protein